MKDYLSVIRPTQIFSGISENEIIAMLSCLEARKESFAKDIFLLHVGDTIEEIGVVLSGSVLIIQEDIWGNRNILDKVGPGQIFAAAYACAPGAVLKVSVYAESPVIAMFLNVKRILSMCPSACAACNVRRVRSETSPASFNVVLSKSIPISLRSMR